MNRSQTINSRDQAAKSKESEALPIIADLRRFRDLFDEIKDLIGDKRFLTKEERVTAKTLLAKLKDDLNAASKSGIPQGRKGGPSVLDSQYFHPAVRGASAFLTVPVNTNPITSRWHNQLSYCLVDINYYLFQIENQFPALKEGKQAP